MPLRNFTKLRFLDLFRYLVFHQLFYPNNYGSVTIRLPMSGFELLKSILFIFTVILSPSFRVQAKSPAFGQFMSLFRKKPEML